MFAHSQDKPSLPPSEQEFIELEDLDFSTEPFTWPSLNLETTTLFPIGFSEDNDITLPALVAPFSFMTDGIPLISTLPGILDTLPAENKSPPLADTGEPTDLLYQEPPYSPPVEFKPPTRFKENKQQVIEEYLSKRKEQEKIWDVIPYYNDEPWMQEVVGHTGEKRKIRGKVNYTYQRAFRYLDSGEEVPKGNAIYQASFTTKGRASLYCKSVDELMLRRITTESNMIKGLKQKNSHHKTAIQVTGSAYHDTHYFHEPIPGLKTKTIANVKLSIVPNGLALIRNHGIFVEYPPKSGEKKRVHPLRSYIQLYNQKRKNTLDISYDGLPSSPVSPTSVQPDTPLSPVPNPTFDSSHKSNLTGLSLFKPNRTTSSMHRGYSLLPPHPLPISVKLRKNSL